MYDVAPNENSAQFLGVSREMPNFLGLIRLLACGESDKKRSHGNFVLAGSATQCEDKSLNLQFHHRVNFPGSVAGKMASPVRLIRGRMANVPVRPFLLQ
jgi:hypothetical protein